MKQTRNDKRRPAEQRGHHNVHVLPIATARLRLHTCTHARADASQQAEAPTPLIFFILIVFFSHFLSFPDLLKIELSNNVEYGNHDSDTAMQRVRCAKPMIQSGTCSEYSPECQARR